ncbi:MAG: hypothetical protein PHE68_04355 [Candidatus Peribacteraceae bacterium]|nr:hypothetical protein [Candidatus Peribacteraceae bacterium]MDD5075072.1 hypothetical protein [Candidatus Peribacteraceae bacterium]
MIQASDLLFGLQVAVAVMLLVVLYHVIFIVVDLRKILRRVEDITKELEDVLMKPLSMVDRILQWVIDMVESAQKKEHHAKKHVEVEK